MGFKAGVTYFISTEGKARLVPNAPWKELIKCSKYAVQTVLETPQPPSSGFRWYPTEEPHIAVGQNGKKYLLCKLASDCGILGSSEFLNPETGEVFSKKQVCKWLQPQSYGEFITIGIDNIREATDMTPVAQATPVEDDPSRDLPF